jgi:hypothetical protein
MVQTKRSKGFFDFLFGLNLERHSLEAERLFRILARRSGDADLLECVESNRAFTYYGLSWGYTYRSIEDGRIWMGLNRLLLFCPKWSFTVFTAGHELGHVRQLLSHQEEEPSGSRGLYEQELEASKFGAQLIRSSKCCGLPSLCRCRFIHCLLARQAAFPVQTLVWWAIAWGALGWGLSFVWGRILDKFVATGDAEAKVI